MTNGRTKGNPTLYGYVYDTLWEFDPFGLINFKNLTDSELIQKIWELAYRDKRINGNSGTHGVVHRIREQIKAELKNLRAGLNEARTRGLTDVVSDKYPYINRVSAMNPPKSTDMEVPKLCR